MGIAIFTHIVALKALRLLMVSALIAGLRYSKGDYIMRG